MKKSALILAFGMIILSCSKKETDTQTNASDSLSADTMTTGTVPMESDTMSMPATPSTTDTATTTMPADSATTTR